MLAHAMFTELIHLADDAIQEVAVMRYDNDCALKGLDGLFQHILAGHVQVVGGLIEDEQVDRLQQQPYHRQAAFLSTAQDLDLLVGILATEHESAQDVVDARAYVAHSHIVDSVMNSERFVEQLRLILSEITDFNVVPNLEFAVIGDFTHEALDQGGFARTVLADKCDLLTTLDGKRHVMEHVERPIVLAQILGNDRIVTTARSRREFQPHARAVHLIDLDAVQLVEHLDAALHLHRLGRLIAETLDEVLGVMDELLLVLIGAHLLFDALLAQFHKLAVAHLVIIDFAQRYLDGAIGHIINKSAVVGYQQQSSVAVLQERLQPLNRLDVQVVGGLIEQQHVGATQQQLRQLDAHAPATAELARGSVEVGSFKAQAHERLLDFGLDVVALQQRTQLSLLRHAFNQFLVSVTVIVSSFGQFLIHAVDGVIHLLQVFESTPGFLLYREFIMELHLLRQVADCDIGLTGNGAVGGLLLPGKDSQHGGFACTVLADQRDLVPLVDDKTDAGKQRLTTKLHLESLYRNHALCFNIGNSSTSESIE